MILVELTNIELKDKELLIKDPIEVKVTGHSLQKSKGNDIVCAGISTLAQNLVKSIDVILQIHQDIEIKEGYLFTHIKTNFLNSSLVNDLKVLLQSFLIGCVEIHKVYPDEIKINLS